MGIAILLWVWYYYQNNLCGAQAAEICEIINFIML